MVRDHLSFSGLNYNTSQLDAVISEKKEGETILLPCQLQTSRFYYAQSSITQEKYIRHICSHIRIRYDYLCKNHVCKKNNYHWYYHLDTFSITHVSFSRSHLSYVYKQIIYMGMCQRSTTLQLSVSDSNNLSNGPGDCAFSYFFYREKKLPGLLLGSNSKLSLTQ